ncbi:hypothetical protein F5148DRAFT_617508 [Russula earlei]|uniref:Uncharacterized protein n=1 Tax=Russula earlei TaxID=71964 RepID=A0ACC0UGP8_9AGAM|nr:hypothetical protein F5148DRAFT_617508 [Russula earlei]
MLAELETTFIRFLPPMPLNIPSSSQPDSKDEIGKGHKLSDNQDHDLAAGPSNVLPAAPSRVKRRNQGKSSGQATPISSGEQKSPATLEEPSFENNSDFIAFGFDDGPEVGDDRQRKKDEEAPLERDWDKGKGKMRERDDGGGKKRKVEFDRSDGYSNKKERTDAASRKAPWVTDVDWEESTNVAELLHREVEAFVRYISPTREEHEVRSLTIALVSQAISQKFEDAESIRVWQLRDQAVPSAR